MIIIMINDEIDVEWYSFLERTPPLPSVSVECSLVREARERDEWRVAQSLASLSLSWVGVVDGST